MASLVLSEPFVVPDGVKDEAVGCGVEVVCIKLGSTLATPSAEMSRTIKYGGIFLGGLPAGLR